VLARPLVLTAPRQGPTHRGWRLIRLGRHPLFARGISEIWGPRHCRGPGTFAEKDTQAKARVERFSRRTTRLSAAFGRQRHEGITGRWPTGFSGQGRFRGVAGVSICPPEARPVCRQSARGSGAAGMVTPAQPRGAGKGLGPRPGFRGASAATRKLGAIFRRAPRFVRNGYYLGKETVPESDCARFGNVLDGRCGKPVPGCGGRADHDRERNWSGGASKGRGILRQHRCAAGEIGGRSNLADSCCAS